MTVIIVTGTPGTGKTTYSKRFAKQNKFEYVDVKKIISDSNLSEGYDNKKQCDIIDTEKLNKILISLIKDSKDIIIDSHLSHYLPKKYVDKCIVTKCDISTLKKRLKKRKYSAHKIRENLDAEILDIILMEAKENGHDVKVIYTDS